MVGPAFALVKSSRSECGSRLKSDAGHLKVGYVPNATKLVTIFVPISPQAIALISFERSLSQSDAAGPEIGPYPASEIVFVVASYPRFTGVVIHKPLAGFASVLERNLLPDFPVFMKNRPVPIGSSAIEAALCEEGTALVMPTKVPGLRSKEGLGLL